MRTPGEIRIPQYAVVTRLLTSDDVAYLETAVEDTAARARTNLTDGVVYFTVIDDDGNVVIQKTSADTNQIEIRNQVVSDTRGQAVVKFTRDDTAALTPGAKYWCDAWVYHTDGTQEPIVDFGRFHVDRSATDIVGGPAPSLPDQTASQQPQEKNWKWTAPTGDSSFTVTIPDGGMVNGNYTLQFQISTLPGGGSWTPMIAPEASRTALQFTLETNSPILAGTVVDFHARNSS